MRPFGARRPKRTVVKAYGRDALFVWLNPFNAALTAILGARVGLRSETQVLDQMEKDALQMAKQHYRVVSAESTICRCCSRPVGRRATTG
jgi:hypothetical protein